MTQWDLIRVVVGVLESKEVPYMVTGSTASSLLGNPRSTHDVDVVIDITYGALAEVLDEFQPPTYFVQRHVARQALAEAGMFNLVCVDSNDKVDFWILGADPFARLRGTIKLPQGMTVDDVINEMRGGPYDL